MGQLAVWNLSSYDTLVMLDDEAWQQEGHQNIPELLSCVWEESYHQRVSSGINRYHLYLFGFIN
jgi:hypothetical protein